MNLERFKKLALFLSSVILFVLWLFFVLNVRAKFYANADSDPLAMINVMFPIFWVILIGFALLCFATFCLEATTRWLHIILLLQLSLMLHYTPFLLAGFSWSPDSLWHGGMANYIPEVLSDSNLPLSAYAKSYPLSFIFTYIMEHILGVEVFVYTLYIYPVVCICITFALAYVLVARFFNPKIAFGAILLTLPALHYFEPHVSPLSFGTILVLMSLFLWTAKGRVAKALSFLNIIILILTHPISPLALGILLMAVILINVFYRKSYLYRPRPETLFSGISPFSLLLFLCIIWFTWTIFRAMVLYIGVRNAILNLLNFGFLKRLVYASEWTVGGKGFIFNDISNLNLAIYGIFLSFVLILALLNLKKITCAWKRHLIVDITSYKMILCAIASILFVIFGYMLFLTSGAHVLLGRGLFFFIFFGSMCISMFLFDQKTQHWEKISKVFLAFGLFLFFLFSFPIVAYSKEAYNSFTPSADAGLRFLSHNINLSKYSLSMGADQQIVSYSNISKGLTLLRFPPNMNVTIPNFIVFRINSYFSISMRYDLSFEDNAFIRLRECIDGNPNYHKVYSNSKFEIYGNP